MSEDIMGRLRTALERFEEATFWATLYGERQHADARVWEERAGVAYAELVAALAAVEQELAALRLSYENASRAHFEATN